MFRIAMIIFCFTASLSYAAQLAITDTGEEVVLNSDGTWRYKSEAIANNKIEKNNIRFKKPIDSTFMLKSTKNNSAFFINTNKWNFKKIKDINDSGEYEFQLIGGDIYGKAITEEASIPVESLISIAYDNAISAAPDARILKKEYRIVNDNDVIYLEMKGTMHGIEFMFLGYYYSDKSGATQLVTWTTPNLVDKYKDEIMNFLNGYTVRK